VYLQIKGRLFIIRLDFNPQTTEKKQQGGGGGATHRSLEDADLFPEGLVLLPQFRDAVLELVDASLKQEVTASRYEVVSTNWTYEHYDSYKMAFGRMLPLRQTQLEAMISLRLFEL